MPLPTHPSPPEPTSGTTDVSATPVEPDPEPASPPAPRLTLRDPLPGVTDDATALAEVAARIAAGTGPIAIDAERASGYRYSQRAYLIQFRREGSGTALVDPIAFDGLAPLAGAFGDAEWILHAATQDLPCLREVGLRPSRLFDTELAGRLLGFPRVGLATLVEELLGMSLAKEHSAADWSIRPLPEPWLQYAALDVEVLVELRDALAERLDQAGKLEWAHQEFAALLDFMPAVRVEPWRRTSGAHRLSGRRAQAAVRALWQTRDQIAQRRDIAPGRIIPDAAIVAAAGAMPTDTRALIATKGFHGRGARRYARDWIAAIAEARELPDTELPGRAPRPDGPPLPRAWADRDPVAARRLVLARAALNQRAEELGLPQENLLTPDIFRRVLWAPPATRDPAALGDAVAEQLATLGARPWQIEHTYGLITTAVLAAEE